MATAEMEGDRRRIRYGVALVAVLALGALFVWHVGSFLLLLFGAVLFAVLLDGLARWLSSHARIPRLVALGIVCLLVVGAIVGGVWLVGPRVSAELARLGDLIPKAVEQVRSMLEEYRWGRALLENVASGKAMTSGSWASRLGTTVTTTLGTLADVLLVPVIAVYLALNPRFYVKGFLALVPKRPERVQEVLETTGHVLRRWLVGRFASMTVVGVLCGVGLALLGVPLALSLGVIAGLFSFVPFLGPIAAVIPAALVALPEGGWKLALWVILLYQAVQAVEGTFITPLIEKKAVFLAPAFLIAFQILMGVLAGILGVILATPLVVVLVVTLQMLYVQDVLGRDVPVLGT